jgi:hypothetical protein
MVVYQTQDLLTTFCKRARLSELKAFYYPKTNIIPSENTQVVNGDRLKIDSRRRSQVRLLLLALSLTLF